MKVAHLLPSTRDCREVRPRVNLFMPVALHAGSLTCCPPHSSCGGVLRCADEVQGHLGDGGGLFGVSLGEQAAHSPGGVEMGRTGDQESLEGSSVVRLKKALDDGR